MRIEQQPGFVLHARAWRETSLLVEVLSRDHGRIGVVARGVHGPRKQPLREVDLQGARQLMVTGRREGSERQRFRISAQVWWVEGDLGVLELVKLGLGWAAVPEFLLHRPLARGELVVLKPDFTAQAELELELQWYRARPLGQAGRWLKEALLARVPR